MHCGVAVKADPGASYGEVLWSRHRLGRSLVVFPPEVPRSVIIFESPLVKSVSGVSVKPTPTNAQVCLPYGEKPKFVEWERIWRRHWGNFLRRSMFSRLGWSDVAHECTRSCRYGLTMDGTHALFDHGLGAPPSRSEFDLPRFLKKTAVVAEKPGEATRGCVFRG